METPVPFPNTEVKLPMFMTLVPDKVRNHEAVFHYFFIVLFLKIIMKKVSKNETEKRVNEFFEEIKNKSLKEIKKIKKLAMSQNVPLREKRKLFCKFCFNPFKGNEKTRIKNKIKSVECSSCGKINRRKIKTS